MKATVVVDNIKSADIPGEWGLCIYIEYAGRKILLDTGASDLFVSNAAKLGLSLEDVDMAVLSHAHYDHANGMKAFFEKNSGAPFYLRESAAPDCYFKKRFIRKYIGMPRDIQSEFPERIIPVRGDIEPDRGIWLIPHKTPGLEAVGRREKMYRKRPDGWYPDDFAHEQSLVLDTAEGLVIFNSCSHGGAANIISEVAGFFPGRNVHAIIGGFHLYNKSEGEVRDLGRKIKETGIKYVCTGHCTGESAYGILEQELGDILHQLHTGLVMEFSE